VSVLSNLVYMLGLLGVGVAARHVGVLTPARSDSLTWFAFTIALPALVFTSTYAQPLESVLSPQLLFGVWGVLATMVALSYAIHRRDSSPGTRSVAMVQSYHGNLGFLGLPIVAATFGGLATAKASLILGIVALTQIPLTITILITVNGSDRSILREAASLVTNPVIGALALGLGFSVAGIGIPDVLHTTLGALAVLALPIALLAVGASLSPEFSGFDVGTIARITALKTMVMPALALGIFTVLAVPLSTLQAGVVMLAMPAAVSTYVYASELGGNEELASIGVFVTTIASLLLVFALIPFLG